MRNPYSNTSDLKHMTAINLRIAIDNLVARALDGKVGWRGMQTTKGTTAETLITHLAEAHTIQDRCDISEKLMHLTMGIET